nr:hypothetical protein Iba_chr11bCG8200 [Ipomoea batatas]
MLLKFLLQTPRPQLLIWKHAMLLSEPATKAKLVPPKRGRISAGSTNRSLSQIAVTGLNRSQSAPSTQGVLKSFADSDELISRKTLARAEDEDDSSDYADEELEDVVEISSSDSETSTAHMEARHAAL